jgi:hypothetical protein
MGVCAKCGNKNQDDAVFCDQCGARLVSVGISLTAEAGGIKCPSCGFSNVAGEFFCENCGIKLPAPEPSAPEPAPDPAAPGSGACPSCGTPVNEGEGFCPTCGAALGGAEAELEALDESGAPPPSPDASGACPACGMPIKGGETYCGFCGASLSGEAPDAASSPEPWSAPASAVGLSGARLVVSDSGAEILIPSKAEVLVGREDPVSNVFPDVDLTPHGGDEAGVSRRHMRILQQGGRFLAEDLGSTNYTLVNRKRLEPGIPHPLAEGDEIRVGRIRLVFRLG